MDTDRVKSQGRLRVRLRQHDSWISNAMAGQFLNVANARCNHRRGMGILPMLHERRTMRETLTAPSGLAYTQFVGIGGGRFEFPDDSARFAVVFLSAVLTLRARGGPRRPFELLRRPVRPAFGANEPEPTGTHRSHRYRSNAPSDGILPLPFPIRLGKTRSVQPAEPP